jgi:hypothetical protein
VPADGSASLPKRPAWIGRAPMAGASGAEPPP